MANKIARTIGLFYYHDRENYALKKGALVYRARQS